MHFLVKYFLKLISIFKKIYVNALLYDLKKRFLSLGANTIIEIPSNVYNPSCITIGHNFTARRNLKLRAFDSYQSCNYKPNIAIGDNVYFATDCHVAAIGNIVIGNNVSLASYVTIIDHNHGKSDYSDLLTPVMNRELDSKGDIYIHDNVWLGEHVVVLSGVTIGKNSIIGANSVVTKSIPANSIAVGIPAKVIKTIYL